MFGMFGMDEATKSVKSLGETIAEGFRLQRQTIDNLIKRIEKLEDEVRTLKKEW